MNIPLSVLIEAAECMRLAVDTTDKLPPNVWGRIMRSHAEFASYVEMAIREQEVEVTA